MIKLGCMSLSYKDHFSGRRMDLTGFIDRAYQLGLDGIDIHRNHFTGSDPAYLRDIRLQCLRRGLAISCIGVSNDFGKREEELEGQVATVKQAVDQAAFMGVPLVRIFAAWVPDGDSVDGVWSRMMPCMREVAGYGEAKGVVLGLQNHNHRCVTRTGKDVRRILTEVNSPYLSHVLDTGQYVGSPGSSGGRGKEDPSLDFYGSIAETAPLAVHVRAKVYRIRTGEEAWLDYPRIFGILREVNYNGWVSLVYEGQDAEPEETGIPKAVRFLRRFAPGEASP